MWCAKKKLTNASDLDFVFEAKVHIEIRQFTIVD